MMQNVFNPLAWYWNVGGSPSQVYSSASNSYVAVTDDDYLAWVAVHGTPTPIATEAEIWPYVQGRVPEWCFDGKTFAQPAIGAYMPAQLIAYANVKQWAVATAGKVVVIGGVPIPFATSDTSLNLMNGKVARLAQPNPPDVVNWQTAPDSFTAIAAADFASAATQVADFVQATFDKLETVIAGIKAGTITTPDAINAAFARV